MYSKYDEECTKWQHRRSQVLENRSYGVDTKSYSIFEDEENIIKIPNPFHQKFEVLREPKYDYEKNDRLDDDFDFLPRKHPPFRTQKYYYQHHDHYHLKANEYQEQKQDHPQRIHAHNHSDHSYRYYYSNIKYSDFPYDDLLTPPSSVHQNSVNRSKSFNNNDCEPDAEDRLNEGYHHQSLPAADHLQFKSPNRISLNTLTEQQYYSYLYNQNNSASKSPRIPRRSRKLPTTLQMQFSKESANSTRMQLNTKFDTISVEEDTVLAANVSRNDVDIDNNPKGSYNFVLKEKSANTHDVPVTIENANWHYNSNNVVKSGTACGDLLDLKSHEFHEYRHYQSFDEEDSEANCLYLQRQTNGKKLRRPNSNIGHFHFNSRIHSEEVQNEEEHINSLSIYEQTKEPICNKKGEIYLRNIKLPTTPTKSKGSPAKKSSSPSKNRRVLIYNIQSPRISGLSTSSIRLQKLKLQNKNTKDYIKNVDVLNGCSPSARKRNCDRIEKFALNDEDKSNIGDNCSDDEDDEFDNVSDFESSSDSSISSDSEEGYRSYAYKITHSLDAISNSFSMESTNIPEAVCLENPDALLVPSLFPNVPPYIAFSSNTRKGPDVPSDLYRVLKWRVTNVMPRVVRSILANSGMRLLKKTNEWMGVWGKHMKSPCFKTIRPYQKINHLPGSFKIGRKDSCWKNLVKLMAIHGKKDFGFMPKTYIIPSDLKQLRKSWPKYAQKNVKWIIKPPASARGTGIRVVDRWAQIPKRKPIIVQKYIERPLLINGSKFDLRLYVLVTSINPLRVYMYHNGLARFASVKYSDKSDTLNDRCMHLTNYSINKLSSNYSKNEDVNACHGHKWTIQSLWAYLSRRGVRTDLLWAALRSLVLRTILAGENSINNMIRANVESKYSCFELFGFDVLLDADLVPWLLEVNISPSLHSELPLDSHVKAPLVQSVLNTALYNIPPKIPLERQREIAVEMSLPDGPICYDKRMYINYLSRTEKIKHNTFTRKRMEERDEYVNDILEHLTPDDVRCLVIAEDELARSSPLERIFPTVDTFKFLKYTETPRYYNRLLDAWESRYSNNRIEGIHLLRQYCEDQYHLQVPQMPTKKCNNLQ